MKIDLDDDGGKRAGSAHVAYDGAGQQWGPNGEAGAEMSGRSEMKRQERAESCRLMKTKNMDKPVVGPAPLQMVVVTLKVVTI